MNSTRSWQSLYPFSTRHFEIDGQKMHYIDEGNPLADGRQACEPHDSNSAPEPPETFLFVHGNPTWSFYWRNLVVQWRDSRRCVAVDHLGCGLSDKPQDHDYCLESHADNLVRLIEALDLRNITLFAHDWGGAIGLLAATQISQRFRRFVLFNTGAFPPPRVPRRIAICRLPGLGTLAVRGLNLFALAAQVMATRRKGGLDRAVLDGLIAPYDTWANRIAIHRFVQDIPLSQNHRTYRVLADLEKQLPELSDRPFLFVWGTQDWCFTTTCLDRFLQSLPAAEVQRIASAGHWVVEDAPAETIRCVDKFLVSHPLAATTTPAENVSPARNGL